MTLCFEALGLTVHRLQQSTFQAPRNNGGRQRLYVQLMDGTHRESKVWLSFEAADSGGTRTRIVFAKTGLVPVDNA